LDRIPRMHGMQVNAATPHRGEAGTGIAPRSGMATVTRTRTATRPRRSRRAPEPPPAEPVVAAKAAGLRYVTDKGPGIRRVRKGKGFLYRNPQGCPVRDRETLGRINALVIPPAWDDVWIATDPDAHLQATGRDAKGRKQYRYHPRWRAVRDETKYARML